MRSGTTSLMSYVFNLRVFLANKVNFGLFFCFKFSNFTFFIEISFVLPPPPPQANSEYSPVLERVTDDVKDSGGGQPAELNLGLFFLIPPPPPP